jgi:hypothetical protein
MKKKSQPTPESIVPQEILELAKKSLETDRPVLLKKCAVCGGSCSPATGPQPNEDLCWVCRRLKISAWRDGDQQMSAQE